MNTFGSPRLNVTSWSTDTSHHLSVVGESTAVDSVFIKRCADSVFAYVGWKSNGEVRYYEYRLPSFPDGALTSLLCHDSAGKFANTLKRMALTEYRLW
jgi:hypothetical protein